MLPNPVKEQIRTGQVSLGTWISIGHPDVAEILGGLGFDWLLLDMEHGPLSISTVHAMMQAMGGSATQPFVRVATNDAVQIGQVLDAGATGVVVPKVQTADDARGVVRACRYPPAGERGIGARRAAAYGRRFQEYVRDAEAQILIAVQIETVRSVENVEEILATPGIDAAFLGPGDLSADLGCFKDRQSPAFVAAIDRVLASCGKHGVAPCMAYVPGPDEALAFIDRGFRMIGMGEDVALLGRAAADVQKVRERCGSGRYLDAQ